MTLNAESRTLLQALRAFPPVESLTPEQARRASQERRAQAPPPSVDVAKVEEESFPAQGARLPVRVYRPDVAAGLPVVVFFHGGGWVLCDLDSHDPLCRSLAAQSGCVVVSVGYRLAPEHRFPTAAEDAYAATQWVSESAGLLGVDASRLAVMGDSAGGNLAAVVALMARDRGGPPLALQSLIYPITDCDTATESYLADDREHFLTRAAMQWYWRHYADAAEARHPYASPLRAPSLAGVAPAYVLTAEHDPLHSEGVAYVRRLRSEGVPTVHRDVRGVFHGFFSLGHLLDSGRVAVADAAAHLRRALHP